MSGTVLYENTWTGEVHGVTRTIRTIVTADKTGPVEVERTQDGHRWGRHFIPRKAALAIARYFKTEAESAITDDSGVDWD